MEVFTNNWNSHKYQIGYALSGGFIKGFAHLGVMQALLEHDIKPDIISGVSAGALAGVFYADGNEPHKVLDYFSGHKFQDLTKLVIPKKGLFDLCEFIDCHVCSRQHRRDKLRRWRINDESSGFHPSQNMRQGCSCQCKSHHGTRL